MNIKIQGSGVGGCNITLAPGSDSNPVEDKSDCWCLWGTINYSFCAYAEKSSSALDSNSTKETGSGKCPTGTGESLVCSDLSSLGNCYNGAYACSIDVNGLCHCQTV